MLLLLLPVAARAYVLCGSPLLSSSIPAYTLQEVPAGTVFVGAEMREVPCGVGGGVVSVAVADPDSGEDLASAEVRWEGSAGFAEVTPELVAGTTYQQTAATGDPRLFVASDTPVPVPEGAPSLDGIAADATKDGAVTLSVVVTPAEYAAGLSLVGLESSDGRLLALTDAVEFGATDLDPAAGDGCYTPLQRFADGSTARGEPSCPTVEPAPVCATTRGTAGAGVGAALVLLAWRRPRRAPGPVSD